jgi:hypothetical protein
MFITKLSLPRRTFLRGMGATVALPWLEAMVPALTAALEGETAGPDVRFWARLALEARSRRTSRDSR